MSHQTQEDHGNERWFEDQEQIARFERRMSATGMSRRAVLGFVGAVAAAAAAACGGGEKETTKATTAPGGSSPAAGSSTGAATGNEKLAKDQVYRKPNTVEPATFDYNFNLYADATPLVSAGLLKFDPEQAPVPDLAESFSVNDKGDIFTFKIRKGTKWSNGDEVKAGDFVYSWTRRLDPTSGADYAAFLHDIKNAVAFNEKKTAKAEDLGLKAVDDYTLQVTLEAPAGYFPALVAYTAAVPTHKASVEKFGKQYGLDADKFVGSGPYKLTKWEHSKGWEIEKNEGYWAAKDLKLTNVKFTIIKIDQQVASFENNEIDNVPQAAFGDFDRLSKDAKLKDQIFKFDQVGSWYLMPNPRFKPFDNIKVRQAMAHAVDRDKYVKDILKGLAAPAFTQNSPGTPFYNPNKYDAATKFDPKLAMDLLKGTEYEGGKNWPKITMSMRNNENDAHKAVMAALIQDFKTHLGMTIDSEIGDPQVVYKEMRQGNKQLMWLRWYMDYPDANNNNYECFYSGIPAGSRRSWWENKEFDDLVLKGKGEPNFQKRKDMYAKSDEILVTEAAAVFLYYPLAYGLRNPKIKGIPKNKAGNFVPNWNIFQREEDFLYKVE